jgi:stress response protein SCP2
VINIYLQEQINQLPAHGHLKLRPGEYEGPVLINSPAIIEGNNATVWAKSGPVLRINTRGLILKNLQVEATANQAPGYQSIAIMTEERHATVVDNVEVKGAVVGFGDESGDWDYPWSLNLGQLPPGQAISLKLRLLVPVRCRLVSRIGGIKFEPEEIAAGLTEVTIKIDPLMPNSIIHGHFQLVSKFIRRISVSGRVTGLTDNAPRQRGGQVIWSPNEVTGSGPDPVVEGAEPYPHLHRHLRSHSRSVPEKGQPEPSVNLNRLKKGHRVDLVAENAAAKYIFGLGWTGRIEKQIEIDVVAFLLGDNEQVLKDNDFVFYGNPRSAEGSVALLGANPAEGLNERVLIDFSKVLGEHKKMVIALSVYQGQEKRQGFAQMAQVFMKAREEASGQDGLYFAMDDNFTLETLLIAAEIYRYKGQWRFAAIGSGYREDLAFLCRKYGLEVE